MGKSTKLEGLITYEEPSLKYKLRY